MILQNAYVVTMDDAGTEHARGWLRVEDGLIAEVGAGDAEGEDLHGAVVTPGLVNVHHHVCQTLTRARAQQERMEAMSHELEPYFAELYRRCVEREVELPRVLVTA